MQKSQYFFLFWWDNFNEVIILIKVIEAISDTNIGGAGILLLNRLKYTDTDLFDTTVLLPENSDLISRFSSIGIKTVAIKGSQDRSFDVKDIRRYYVEILKIAPQIINSHGSLSSRIAAKRAGVPIKFYTRHCVYPTNKIYKSAFVRYLFGRGSDFLSDKVIAVAHCAKENLMEMGMDSKKIKVIINGAEALRKSENVEKEELRKKLKINRSKTVVAICARLEKCKDHECFIKAARYLCDKSDDYRFLIIGTGSLEKELKQLVDAYSLASKVIFTGFLNDVSDYMNIVDINVNCSIGTETSSLALSEGMSLGIPSVVSDYGGNTYMVKNNVNGYVYKAGDFVQLASKIEEVKRNFFALSIGSLKRFEEELNAPKMAYETQQLYLNLYNKKFKI